MTDQREPRETEFSGWHIGPFFGGRSHEITADDRIRRARTDGWVWIAVAALLLYSGFPLLALLPGAYGVLSLLAVSRQQHTSAHEKETDR